MRSRLSVLIVPLWNWNEEAANGGNAFECFNRTFMELKYGNQLYSDIGQDGFNRTFMELKLG